MQASQPGTLRLAMLLAAAMLLNACAPIGGGTRSGNTAADQAAQLQLQGQYTAAADAYLRAAAGAANSTERQDYQLRAVDALLQAGDTQRAKAVLAKIERSGLNRPLAERRALAAAGVAMAENKPEQALLLLPQLAPDSPLDVRVRALQLRARADQATGNLFDSVRTRVQLQPLLQNPQAQQENLRATWGTLNGLPADALERLRTAPAPDVLSGWLELAHIVKTSGASADMLNAAIAAWRQRYPNHPADTMLEQLLAQQREFRQRPRHIALLLPLTGTLADAAAAVRDGFLAAYYAQPAAQRKSSIRVYDTGAPNANIWGLYSKAVKDGADFIVGPLDKAAVTTLARGSKLDVPILALNFADATNPNGAPPADNFFQFSLSPEDEARQIAERASLEGLNHAATIVPDGDWGTRLLTAFTQRFQQLGGVVVTQARYNVANSDFSTPIRQMLNLDQSRARYRALRSITGRDIKFETRRRQDVDFVFMAAFPRQARLIAPQLRFYHASGLPVYATSHVYDGTPDPRDDRDMDGVAFCDMPWTLVQGAAESPLHTQIDALWPQSSERFPRLYAFGVDAFDVMPYLRWLRQQPYERYAGETGSLYLDQTNHVHRTLLWARFIDGSADIIQQPVTPKAVTVPGAASGSPGDQPSAPDDTPNDGGGSPHTTPLPAQ